MIIRYLKSYKIGYKIGYKKIKVCNLGVGRLKIVSGYKMILGLQNG